MNRFLSFLTGYVKIAVRNGQTERFLNLCMAKKIILWELAGSEAEGLTCFITVKDFFLLDSVRRKTGVRIHILEKHGLPFLFIQGKKRWSFFLGISFFFLLLFFLSGRIWNIHIEGNTANSSQEILEYLNEQGVYHGIKKSSVDCSSIAAGIRGNYPETAWVSARMKGTRLIITMKEGDFQKKEDMGKDSPCSIIAEESGTIVKMVTRAGVPQKRPGDTCKKGDVLVLGRLELKNDSQEIFRYEYVHSDADIYIRRKLSYYAQLPLEYEKIVYLDGSRTGGFFRAGALYFQWGGKDCSGWDRMLEDHPLRLTESFVLPVSIGKITWKPYEKKTVLRSEQEAKAEAFRILQKFEEKLMEKGVQIFSNNVKIKVDHKICQSKGSLEIIEKIGTEAPVEKPEQPEERTTEND